MGKVKVHSLMEFNYQIQALDQGAGSMHAGVGALTKAAQEELRWLELLFRRIGIEALIISCRILIVSAYNKTNLLTMSQQSLETTSTRL